MGVKRRKSSTQLLRAKPLRALLVEDSAQDAELLLRQLFKGGFIVTHQRVDTLDALRAALETGTWDLVLSDYSLPHFSALDALKLMQQMGLDLPFIILSGTVLEDVAVHAMRSGAHDYFSKSELGPRLFAAIDRELHEAKVRAENLKINEQLMISDCMASMGTLAAGIAHEINNPLASAMANIDLMLGTVKSMGARGESLQELQDLKDGLGDAREAVERIRNIVRDLKIFSRPRQDDSGPVNVEKVMESTLRMAWNEIRYRARLVKSYGNCPPVQANESRLGQVFLNLVVNAAQAMNEAKWSDNRLTISTATDERGHCLIEVRDTGAGMAPEVKERVFQPFFTTKPLGVGTGIGLSICHRIISDLGGSISVDSEVGKGSAFRVILPPAQQSTSDRAPAAAPARGRAPRAARVLVVDDEPMIHRAAARAIGDQHQVVAMNSTNALTRIRNGERFDVILCDLLMPEISGMDFYEEVARIDAKEAAKIIFLTGGAFTPRAQAFLSQVPNQRIEKPFDPIHLRALINDRVR
jgi:signal transduction histidine kinase